MVRPTEDAIKLLLEMTWPRLREAIPLADRWGASWFSLSRPFVKWHDDQAIAHVGAMSTEIVTPRGRERVGAVHAVCVSPSHRGRGHARHLLEEALAWFEAQEIRTQILYAVEPAIYERFGFRVVHQHVYELAVRSRGRPASGGRLLDVFDPRDLDLIASLLSERTPVSEVFSVPEPRALFLLDLALAQTAGVAPMLLHVPMHEAILVYSMSGSTLLVWDVVAKRLPELGALLHCVPTPYGDVALEFAPDRFVDAKFAKPVFRVPEDILMIRGSFDPGEALAVPPLSRW